MHVLVQSVPMWKLYCGAGTGYQLQMCTQQPYMAYIGITILR